MPIVNVKLQAIPGLGNQFLGIPSERVEAFFENTVIRAFLEDEEGALDNFQQRILASNSSVDLFTCQATYNNYTSAALIVCDGRQKPDDCLVSVEYQGSKCTDAKICFSEDDELSVSADCSTVDLEYPDCKFDCGAEVADQVCYPKITEDLRNSSDSSRHSNGACAGVAAIMVWFLFNILLPVHLF